MSYLKAKMHQNRLWLGLRPKPWWGSLQHSPRPSSWIQEVLLLREREWCREGEGWGWVKGRKEGKWGRERKEGRKKGGREGKRGEEERNQEGDTRHTNPTLLPAPLYSADNFQLLIIQRSSTRLQVTSFLLLYPGTLSPLLHAYNLYLLTASESTLDVPSLPESVMSLLVPLVWFKNCCILKSSVITVVYCCLLMLLLIRMLCDLFTNKRVIFKQEPASCRATDHKWASAWTAVLILMLIYPNPLDWLHGISDCLTHFSAYCFFVFLSCFIHLFLFLFVMN